MFVFFLYLSSSGLPKLINIFFLILIIYNSKFQNKSCFSSLPLVLCYRRYRNYFTLFNIYLCEYSNRYKTL